MFGGGGGMNPRKMKQMMEQMGVDIADIDAEEVIIRTGDEDLVFTDAEVQRMDAQGQETYTIVGSPDHRDHGAGGDAEPTAGGSVIEDAGGDDSDGGDAGIPQEDVELVAQRAGVGKDDAREALDAADGDLASAIARLE
jgi:nascent polypeptide-associated complex subunit alpha